MLFSNTHSFTVVTLFVCSLSYMNPISARPTPLSNPAIDTRNMDESKEEKPKKLVKIEFEVPRNTRIMNLDGGAPVRGGSDKKAFVQFDFIHDLEDDYPYDDYTDSSEKGWKQKSFEWRVYDPEIADDQSLDDEFLFYIMKCSVQTSGRVLDAGTHTFKLATAKPFFATTGEEEWELVQKQANIICPEADGKCKHKDGCDGLAMLKWDQKALDDRDD